MANLDKILAAIRENPKVSQVPRPREGLPPLLRKEIPRINIQNDHGKAKPYQVRQVLAAINRLEEQS